LKHYSLDDANDPSTKYLKMLEGSFVWEARSLYIVAVVVPLFIFYEPAGFVIAGLGLLVVVVMVRPCIRPNQNSIHPTLHHVCIYVPLA
jgi:hypothetical protein